MGIFITLIIITIVISHRNIIKKDWKNGKKPKVISIIMISFFPFLLLISKTIQYLFNHLGYEIDFLFRNYFMSFLFLVSLGLFYIGIFWYIILLIKHNIKSNGEICS
jgi:hypothetical protein